MDFIKYLFSNHVLNTASLGWFIAQFLKGLIASVRARRLLVDRFFLVVHNGEVDIRAILFFVCKRTKMRKENKL